MADNPTFKPTSQSTLVNEGLVNRECRTSIILFNNTEVSIEGLDAVRQSLFLGVCTLAAWLHLKCGLSRASTSRLLKILGFIVHTAIELGRLLTIDFTQQDRNRTTSGSLPPRIPHDVRSAMSALDIEPNII